MAKVDERALYVGLASLTGVGVVLYRVRSRFLFQFSVAIFSFVGLEVLLGIVGTEAAGAVWWLIHSPSALALGVDEILERHGVVVSTLAHIGDLLLWSLVVASGVTVATRKRIAAV